MSCVRRAHRHGGVARWAVTLAATVASTCVLDLVATAGGVLLVASRLFDGASSRAAVVGLLAASYALWGAGLVANLKANWQLLVSTGTSTNLLSKVGFDLARARTGRPGPAKMAAAAGYVGIEVAKELPYYIGAFGTAAVSGALDTTDALVFLAGANLGAAAYEASLALATRAVLRRPWRVPCPDPAGERAADHVTDYASFDADWVPQHYLAGYYRTLEPDERATIAFFVDAIRHAPPNEPILLLGVGPTMHHVFLAAPVAAELHLADYLPANLAEVERWLGARRGAHDWRAFVRYTLECEGVTGPSAAAVAAREQLTRQKVTALLHADASRSDPLSGPGRAFPSGTGATGRAGHPGGYGTVISAYCADSATADVATWEAYMRHIGSLVRPGGLFIVSALRRSAGYVVGGKRFPSACVDETDLRRVLSADFDVDNGALVAHELVQQPDHGYAGIVLGWVRRSTGADDRRTANGSSAPGYAVPSTPGRSVRSDARCVPLPSWSTATARSTSASTEGSDQPGRLAQSRER